MVFRWYEREEADGSASWRPDRDRSEELHAGRLVASADGLYARTAGCGVSAVTTSVEAFTAAACAASPGGRRSGVERAVMPLMGAEALICYRLDAGEHARRQRAGAGAISSADVLELLLGLPVAAPVPVASLTCRERAALDRAPHGAVSVCCGEVTRFAVAPVAVELALVAAGNWRAGLGVAGRFAPFCARAVVLSRRPANLADVQMEAGFYGVGVIMVEDQSAEILVEPAPFRRRRVTAAGWRFVEEVYRLARRSWPPR